MNFTIAFTTFLFFNIFWINLAWGLTPMESLILGDMEQQFEREFEKKDDDEFLNYIFNYKALSGDAIKPYKINLMNYRGFYEEGGNLLNFCTEQRHGMGREVRYLNIWERNQVKRSMMATLQYIGLDVLTRSLGGYAKFFEFTENEYGNFVESLVGENCSANITIISLKELKRNLRFRFKEENVNHAIPNIKNNPFFPDKMETQGAERDILEKEFYENIRLFKSLCSWGNDPSNVRLLVPLLRNPVVMSFIIRQMVGKKINHHIDLNVNFLDEDSATVKILCRGLICRRESNLLFAREFPKSVGQTSLEEDLKRLYCEDLRDINYQTKNQIPTIKKIINTQSFDEENFLVSTFISLMTGIPDFFIRAQNFNEGRTFTRFALEHFYDNWALEQLKNKGSELFYEEFLTLDVVPREHYFSKFNYKLSVLVDVNLGEYDKTLYSLGKIKTTFNLRLRNSFIYWIKKRMQEIPPNELDQFKWLRNRLEIEILPQIEKARELFDLPPWATNLEKLLAQELFEQIRLLSKMPEKEGIHEIQIQFNYGMFALKYLEYRNKVEKLLKSRQKEVQMFKNKNTAK